MEKFQEHRNLSIEKIKLADHILTQTYPFVKDNKLLLTVVENIFLSLHHSISSLLYYERLFKRIPSFQDTFESKLNIFRYKVIDKYNIGREYLLLLLDVLDIIKAHKKSTIEFSKKDSFLMFSENYKLKEISISKLKTYISQTKSFNEIINKLVSRHERIFK